MYQPSTIFPQVTNRESWSQLIGVYDDATGDPVNLSNTSGQGTFSTWAVQIAASLYGTPIINTTSANALTIGNNSFSDVIAPDLNIQPGQYVTYISQSDTKNWMTGQVTFYNSTTGQINFTIATVSIELEIRRAEGHGANYMLGPYDWGSPILTASIGNGISIVDVGIFQVYFSETSFRSLGSGMHSVAATMASADGIDVRQLFLGRLPVFSGRVLN